MQQSTLNFIYFLAVIGGIWFIIYISKFLWHIIKLILPSKNYIERYGQNTWAVVTGGSDGLGLGFCQELAELGFNICMVARNKQKMDNALEKIKKQNQDKRILTKIIQADFTLCQSDPNFFNKIKRQLQQLKDISILVNNVGISSIGLFHQIPDTRIINQINVNIISMSMMSHILIPSMLLRQKRSAIINISSFSAQHPIPYVSTYSATKAFNDFFSQAIEMQYQKKIDVLSVRPMYVQSNMSKKKKSFTVASRNQCAKASLGCLGLEYETNGYYPHIMLATITGLLPKPLIRSLSESSSRQIMNNQKENQKKIAQ